MCPQSPELGRNWLHTGNLGERDGKGSEDSGEEMFYMGQEGADWPPAIKQGEKVEFDHYD